MLAMPGRSSGRHFASWANGRSKSSDAPIAPKASNSCPNDGWLNEHWHGSGATAGSPKTSKQRSPPPPHGSSSPASASCQSGSQEIDIKLPISIQTLSLADTVSQNGSTFHVKHAGYFPMQNSLNIAVNKSSTSIRSVMRARAYDALRRSSATNSSCD